MPDTTTPVLVSLNTTGVFATNGVELHFNTAMAAGAGTIWITDGAVQTVIDRVTGLPRMRIMGGTDTHAIAASSADITGSTVTLHVPGLLADHGYHVYMDRGALASGSHVAFAGLREAGAGNGFTTPDDGADVVPPTQLGIETDAHGVHGGGSEIVLHVKFDEAVHAVGTAPPQLALSNHAHAVFDAARSTATDLAFVYTVDIGDEITNHLDLADERALAGQLADAAGNLLDLAHIQVHGLQDALHPGQQAEIIIDPVVPVPSTLPAPQLAVLSDTLPVGDNKTTDFDPVVEGIGAIPTAFITVYVDGASVGTTTADHHGNWSFTTHLPGGGTYHIGATQTDGGNQTSPLSPALELVIDTPPSAGASLAPGSDTGLDGDGITSVALPVLQGAGADGTYIRLYDNGLEAGYGATIVNGAWTISLTNALSEGQHTFTISQEDVNGHILPPSHAIPLNVTIDTIAPLAPAAPALSPNWNAQDTTPTLTGTAQEAGGTIDIYENDQLLGSAAVGADKTWTFTTPFLEDGTHHLAARQVDLAGNASAPSAPVDVLVDTTVPTYLGMEVDGTPAQGKIILKFSEQVFLGPSSTITLANHDGDVKFNGRASYSETRQGGWAYYHDAETPYGIVLYPELDEDSHLTLAVTQGAIVDAGGHAVVIGTLDVTYPGH